jgi:hypothetical protein
MSGLQRLQAWYAGYCNGDWEHDCGVKIETIDDPGWCVRVGLRGTPLQSRSFDELERLRAGSQWVHCRVRNGCFEGYGGPLMLEEIVSIFFAWAETRAEVSASTLEA